MKERPILFSGDMVRAILEGRKTQTRRVMKNAGRKAEGWAGQVLPAKISGWIAWYPGNMKDLPDLTKQWYEHGFECPYGEVGDRLWVRETHALEIWTYEFGDTPPLPKDRPYHHSDDGEGEVWEFPHYKATDPEPELCYDDMDGPGCRWRPSIHMPRWASRILLEVTGVRVERVQDISEADAIAEGIPQVDDPICPPAVVRYAILWDLINAERGFSWAVNPWVWVIEFKRVQP